MAYLKVGKKKDLENSCHEKKMVCNPKEKEMQEGKLVV